MYVLYAEYLSLIQSEEVLYVVETTALSKYSKLTEFSDIRYYLILTFFQTILSNIHYAVIVYQ